MKAGIDYIGVSIGAVIINSKNEILLLKRSQNAKNEKGKWEAPGGAVEFWEKREQAVKREMKEELGVDIEIIDILQVVDEILSKDRQHWVGTSYLVKIKGKQKPQIMEPKKHDAIGWYSLDNLPSPMSWVTKSDINSYKKRLTR
jgi:8-oxo-dGTP diphosphatase